MKFISVYLLLGLMFSVEACQGKGEESNSENEVINLVSVEGQYGDQYSDLDTATLAGGCFWCIEASFEQIEGVREVVSGYSGGEEPNPSYTKVSRGATGHAEAVQIMYDPEIIDFETILDIFFVAHDPTQLNRQGPDVGKQYRSAIFYHNKQQKEITQRVIKKLEDQEVFSKPIVTQVGPLDSFWVAERYHQDYAERNPNDRYIQSVSLPKVKKVSKTFPELIK